MGSQLRGGTLIGPAFWEYIPAILMRVNASRCLKRDSMVCGHSIWVGGAGGQWSLSGQQHSTICALVSVVAIANHTQLCMHTSR
jgi:hypothetical protein